MLDSDSKVKTENPLGVFLIFAKRWKKIEQLS